MFQQRLLPPVQPRVERIMLFEAQRDNILRMYDIFLKSHIAVDTSDTGTGKTYSAIGLAIMLGLPIFLVAPGNVNKDWHSLMTRFGVQIATRDSAGAVTEMTYDKIRGKAVKTRGVERHALTHPYFTVDTQGEDSSQYDTQDIAGGDDDDYDRPTKKSPKKKNDGGSSSNRKRFIPTQALLDLVEQGTLFVFDEIHSAKNPASLNAKAVRSIVNAVRESFENRRGTSRVLTLSATLIDNQALCVPLLYNLGIVQSPKLHSGSPVNNMIDLTQGVIINGVESNTVAFEALTRADVENSGRTRQIINAYQTSTSPDEIITIDIINEQPTTLPRILDANGFEVEDFRIPVRTIIEFFFTLTVQVILKSISTSMRPIPYNTRDLGDRYIRITQIPVHGPSFLFATSKIKSTVGGKQTGGLDMNLWLPEFVVNYVRYVMRNLGYSLDPSDPDYLRNYSAAEALAIQGRWDYVGRVVLEQLGVEVTPQSIQDVKMELHNNNATITKICRDLMLINSRREGESLDLEPLHYLPMECMAEILAGVFAQKADEYSGGDGGGNTHDAKMQIKHEMTFAQRLLEKTKVSRIEELVRHKVVAQGQRLESNEGFTEDDTPDVNSKAIISLNFKENIEELASRLHEFNPKILYGETEQPDRRSAILEFQKPTDPNSLQNRVIILHPVVGGQGVSLHDVAGNNRRSFFISPNYSITQMHQCLGRAQRRGALTQAITRFVYCGTPLKEIAVLRKLGKKSAVLIEIATATFGSNELRLPGTYDKRIVDPGAVGPSEEDLAPPEQQRVPRLGDNGIPIDRPRFVGTTRRRRG